jgi:DNA-directed RNA polymerase specialized sigma24 family protein
MKTVVVFSDTKIVDGIRNKNNAILKYLYKMYYSELVTFGVSKGLREADARDIFQETIITLYLLFTENDYKLTHSFKNFFYVLYQRRIVDIRRKKGIVKMEVLDPGSEEQNIDVPESQDEFMVNHLEREKTLLYQKHFFRLEDMCRNILIMFFNKVRLNVIAKEFNFPNVVYARQRKIRCQKYLIEQIKNDPIYKNLYEHENI